MATSVLFPPFLYGNFAALHKATLKLGRAWAKSYQQSQSFPKLDLIPILEGARVFTADVSDFERLTTTPEWRLYFVRRLKSAITDSLPRSLDWDAARAAFEAHILGYSWGALDLALGHSRPNTLEIVSRRLRSVFTFWGELDALTYVDRNRRTVGLVGLLAEEFADIVGVWTDNPTSDIRADLEQALLTAEKATLDDTRARLARRMALIARSTERIERKGDLSNEAWLLERLASFEDHRMAAMKTGYDSSLRRELFKLAKE